MIDDQVLKDEKGHFFQFETIFKVIFPQILFEEINLDPLFMFRSGSECIFPLQNLKTFQSTGVTKVGYQVPGHHAR